VRLDSFADAGAVYADVVIPLWGFVAVTAPLVLTPGLSTTVVLRNSIAGGVRAGLATAAGVNTGSFCYGLLTAFGFALALQRWPTVWVVLRVVGVLYLAWLGVKSLRRALARAPIVELSSRVASPGTAWSSAYEGFVTNALNPAIATFYFVLVPQFIPRGAPFASTALLLSVIHVCFAGLWHIAWAAAGGALTRTLAVGKRHQVLEAATGMALLALATRMAVR
jgi:threonine/homoserine/homoserine lactone efflux protein